MTDKQVKVAKKLAKVITKKWKKPLHRYDLVQGRDGNKVYYRAVNFESSLKENEFSLGAIENFI